MAKIDQSSGATAREIEPTFVQACNEAEPLTQRELIAIAIARGCRHYAPLWPDIAAENRAHLPHEVLGCALLRGPRTTETFQAIRCGAMVLSDLANRPESIVAAAHHFGVLARVAHLIRLGAVADEHREYWQPLLTLLSTDGRSEEDFLPGRSRLVVETRLSGPGRGPESRWLRTAYHG